MFCTMVRSLLLCALGLAVVSAQQAVIDDTLRPGASGKDVVLSVLDKIDSACIFKKDKQMLRNIAQAETRDGANGTSNGGIWQVPQAVFDATKNGVLSSFVSRFPSAFKIQWATATYSDLSKPLYSALAARLAIALNQREDKIDNADPLDGKLPWNVPSQAAIWIAVYAGGRPASQYTAAVTAIRSAVCYSKAVEIAFVLDSSGSIGQSNFDTMKAFVQDVIQNFQIARNATQFGIVSFSSSVDTVIRLNQYHDKNALLNAVRAIPFSNGGTSTQLALGALRTNVFDPSNGLRAGTPKIAVVITDGASHNQQATATEAASVHRDNITAYSVGISGGQISGQYATELLSMASSPSCKNLYHLKHVRDLAEAFAMEIKQKICEEAAVIEIGSVVIIDGVPVPPMPVQVTIVKGQPWYACYLVPVDTVSTIEVKTHRGSVQMFVSLTTRKPSQADNMLSSVYRQGGRPAKVVITPSMIFSYKPQATGSVTVCVGMVNLATRLLLPLSSSDDGAVEFSVIRGVYGQCGGSISLRSGQSTEEAGPGYFNGHALGYAKGQRCQWNLPEFAGHYYRIEFVFFKLRNYSLGLARGDDCTSADHVTVAGLDAKKRQTLCGGDEKQVGPTMEQNGPVTITFDALDEAPPGFGLNMVITALPDY